MKGQPRDVHPCDESIERPVDHAGEAAPNVSDTSAKLQGSPLDRELVLPTLSASTLVAVAAIGCAALVRLIGLDRFAVTPREAEIALAARALITGDGAVYDLAAHPVVVDLVAVVMFLGHSTESIGRVGLALTGVAAVVATLALNRWIGGLPSLFAAILIATSPTLIASSRAMDAGGLSVLLLLALLVLVFAARDQSGLIGTGAAGSILGALLLTGPLGPVTSLIGLGILLSVPPLALRRTPRASLTAILTGASASIVIFGTGILTRPGAFFDAVSAIFEAFWRQHLSNFGDAFHLPLWNLLINEPLLSGLAIYAVATRRDLPLVRLLTAWSASALGVLSLLSVQDPAGFALTVLPIALLAGFGAAELAQGLRLPEGALWPAAGFLASAILLVFAFVSVMLLAIDNTESTASSIVQFILILAVAVVPLAFVISMVGSRLDGYRLKLLGLAAIVLLGGFTLRSAVLTASVRPGEPGEILYAGAMSPGLPTLVDTLHKISRDLTRTDRSAQMPVGGVDLRVVIDEEFETPLRWYFREYPNVSVIDPTVEPLPAGTQVAFLREGLDESLFAPTLRGQTYVYRFTPSRSLTDPSWRSLASDAFSLTGWQDLVNYLIHRDLNDAGESVTMRVLGIPTVADRLFAESGPFDLDERAGPGRAAGQFIQPRGIAIDESGRIFVVDAGNGRIQRFAPDGTHQLTFGTIGDGPGELGPFPSGPGGAGGVTVGSDGNVYVADTWNHRIVVFTPDGNLVTSWGSFYDAGDQLEEPTTEGGRFYGPRGIVADGSGLLYVTDTGNERIQVFTETGEFVTAFGRTGSGPGELLEPVGIAVAPTGEVLVADSHNARIARFEPNGAPLDTWRVPAWEEQRFFEPYIAVSTTGLVAVSSSATGEVIILDQAGQQVNNLTDPELRAPYGLVFTSNGESLLVTDGQRGTVLELALSVEN